MKLMLAAIIAYTVVVLVLSSVEHTTQATTQAPDSASATAQKKEPANDLVYADFENTKYDRPASSRGGFVQLFSYEQNAALPPKFKGLAGTDPPAPELVRLQKDDPNAAAAFEFELLVPINTRASSWR